MEAVERRIQYEEGRSTGSTARAGVIRAETELDRGIRRRRLVKEELVYGPLLSRRLGRSLGLNLLGFGEKVCSFNCRYCQCGWTKHPTMEIGDRVVDLPSVENVTSALESKLQQLRREKVPIDVITFSGNGEPTLHPELGAIVKVASEIGRAHV